jgi:hypothetical protein
MKTLEQKRQDPCYGELRCWGPIQAICPAYDECYVIAGGVRKVDRVQRGIASLHKELDVKT